MTKVTIGSVITDGIKAGKTNEEVVALVLQAFPDAQTKSASVNWYRSQLKRAGGDVPKQPKKVEVAKAVESTVKGYSVGSLKTFPGEDTPGYSVKLYRDGKHVCTVTDYGNGGETNFDWADKDGPTTVVVVRDHKGETHGYRGTIEEAKLARHVLDMTYTYEGQVCHTNRDIFVEELVGDLELLKKWRKLSKKVAYINGMGALYTVNAEPTPENIKKYVTAENAKVLNGLSDEEVLVELKKLQ
jgi:hypothetical protein